MIDLDDYAHRLRGCLIGLAVADAIGLPREGLTPRRARRLYGDGPLRHHLLLGKGMVSDDTEHHCMTAQALLAAPDDAQRFGRSLAWRLRGWFLGLPPAIGMATLKGILKLWIGFPPHRSGVCSAGNGPAMRAPILGACLGSDPGRLARFVRAATRITHTDPRAEQGALAIGLAAWHGLSRGPGGVDAEALIAQVGCSVSESELAASLACIPHRLAQGRSAQEFAEELGLSTGVTGFINHTVPVCLYCWLRHTDSYRDAVRTVILLGGDTDTTAAIVGGVAGATLGEESIPQSWIAGLRDYPRSVAWIRRLGDRLAEQLPLADSPARRLGPLPLFWPAIGVRNVVFTLTVLAHGFRRLLPPY